MKNFHPLDLGRPILNELPPPPPPSPPPSPTSYGTATAPCSACERTKSKQNKTKSHVTFKLTTRSVVRSSLQTMQWYH